MKTYLWHLLFLGLFFEASPVLSEEQPSIELLEFLGEWQDDQGKSVDPFDFTELLDFPPQPQQLKLIEQDVDEQVEND